MDDVFVTPLDSLFGFFILCFSSFSGKSRLREGRTFMTKNTVSSFRIDVCSSLLVAIGPVYEDKEKVTDIKQSEYLALFFAFTLCSRNTYMR